MVFLAVRISLHKGPKLLEVNGMGHCTGRGVVFAATKPKCGAVILLTLEEAIRLVAET